MSYRAARRAPLRHPVAWFAAGLVVVALGLAAVWWTGLVTPRVTVRTLDIHNEVGRGITGFEFTVGNDGPLPIHVVGVGMSGSAAHPLPPLRVAPGDEVVVRVPVAMSGCEDEHLRFRLRSPLGLVRDIDMSKSALAGLCAS